MTSTPDDVLAALRSATASRHALLDQAMPLAKPAPGLGDYRDHLLLLHPWLACIAQAGARHADGPQDPSLLPPLERLRLIERDLADLADLGVAGGTAEPGLEAGAVVAGRQPEPAGGGSALASGLAREGAAWRWGVAYVVEGSQLGGAVLYRQLAGHLAPHPLRYLHGNGVPPAPRWQLFLARLRAEVHGEAAIGQACAGARAAFDALIALLPRAAPQLAQEGAHGGAHGGARREAA